MNVSLSLTSCLLLLFINRCYDLSNGVIKQPCPQSILLRFKRRLAGQASSQKILGLCFFYEVLLFTCQTSRCHRPRFTAVSHYSHDASVGKCMTGWELILNCGSVLSQQAHQLYCKSPLCVLLQNWLNPSELSPVWCSRRRVPRCKWTSRAINIDPTNVTKHRPRFARTPLTSLTKGT